MFLLEAAKNVKVTAKDIARFEKLAVSWPVFVKNSVKVSDEDLLKLFRWEVDIREVARRDVLARIVGIYNRRFGRLNRKEVDAYVTKKHGRHTPSKRAKRKGKAKRKTARKTGHKLASRRIAKVAKVGRTVLPTSKEPVAA